MRTAMSPEFWNLFGPDYTVNCRAWTHFPGNPILPPEGTGWRRRWTANPDILNFQGKTLLYYRGNGVLTDDPAEPDRDRMGMAVVDEIGPRVLRLGDPAGDRHVIDVGPAGTFDADNVLDPASVVFQDRVWLYYSATATGFPDAVGLAVSDDGVHFQKIGAVIDGRAPEIVLGPDGVLRMIYQIAEPDGSYTLRLATSTDGRDFTPHPAGRIFARPPGEWDSFSLVTCRINIGSDGLYTMIYGGSSYLSDEPEYFGLARSKDMIEWETHPGNPIFGAGARGEPDGGAIWFPAILETESSYVMLYEGSRGKYSWDLHSQICMAWIDKKS